MFLSKQHISSVFIASSVAMLLSCSSKTETAQVAVEEDKEAKALLQGIWLGAEDNEVNIKVNGDTIYYADTSLSPVAFTIENDSLVLHGLNTMRYAIVKQSANIFQFENQAGEIIKLVKSTDKSDNYPFTQSPAIQIIQNQLIKRDSVITSGTTSYHAYVQINPSTYKVIATSYNNDGVQVDNVYYDNIINVCVYSGAKRLFSHDYRKQDFSKLIPSEYISQAILSDVTIEGVSEGCAVFKASICRPDSQTSYIVRISIDNNGRPRMALG